MIDCSNCKLCYLGDICNPVNSLYTNDTFNKIICIDYKPTDEEDLTGKAWYGRIGQLGVKLLSESFNLKNLYFSYLIKCSIGLKKTSEINICKSNWICKEIEQVRPKFIFLFGKEVSHRLLTKPKTKVTVGNYEYYKEYKCMVLNSLSKCLDNKNLLEENRRLIKDVKLAQRLF